MAVEINDKCDKLTDLNRVQRTVLRRHLPKHKWFRHIPDEITAVNDFMAEFGPIMGEIYCEGVCEHVKTCQIYQDYLAGKIKIYTRTG